jgi:tetratricopeptide (TPR) repeat protein
MSPFFDEPKRRLVPRWRDSLATIATGELAPIPANRPLSESTDDFLAPRLEEWQRDPSLGVAADVLSSAFTLHRTGEVHHVAEVVLSLSHEAGPDLTRLARLVLDGPEGDVEPAGDDRVRILETDARAAVRRLRTSLKHYPTNAIGWVDLARWYAILGRLDRADKAMGAALTVAPDNRFTLRSATRLFVHIGQADRAMRVLRRSRIVREDPWLIAAELAVSEVAGSSPKLVKEARAMLKGESFAAFHTAELAGALASLEFGAGANKAARRLFELSLRDPTENTVAQAEWASRRGHISILEQRHLELPLTYEARAWEHFREENWSSAIREAHRWLADEPFSTRSAIFGSFLAGVISDDHQMAESFAATGLLANPHEKTLLNNYAYSLALTGRIAEAEVVYARLTDAGPDANVRAAWLATGGLIQYRKGNIEGGRNLYAQALAYALEQKEPLQQAMAILNCVREEARIGSPDAPFVFEHARTLLDAPEVKVLKPLADRIAHELRRIPERVGEPIPNLPDVWFHFGDK